MASNDSVPAFFSSFPFYLPSQLDSDPVPNSSMMLFSLFAQERTIQMKRLGKVFSLIPMPQFGYK
jgi:hypothetical protein